MECEQRTDVADADATKSAAKIMGRGYDMGTISPGKLTDIIVVDGDSTAGIALLQGRLRFIAVIQRGW